MTWLNVLCLGMYLTLLVANNIHGQNPGFQDYFSSESFTINSQSDEIFIQLAAPDYNQPFRFEIEEKTFHSNNVSLLKLIQLKYNLYSLNSNRDGFIRINSRNPYEFLDLSDGLFKLIRVPIKITATCNTCEGNVLYETLVEELMSMLKVEMLEEYVPVYKICQNTPDFLRDFHSTKENFSKGEPVRTIKEGDYYVSYNITLDDALEYLFTMVRALKFRDESCSFYSRVYSKPFKIPLTGTKDERIQEFADLYHLNIEIVDGESWRSLVLSEME